MPVRVPGHRERDVVFRSAVLALLALLAAMAAVTIAQLLGVSSGVRVLGRAAVTEPVTLEQPELTSQTLEYEKTLEDGTKITFTCPRMVGEDFDTWVARCAKEWKAICEENEGGD